MPDIFRTLIVPTANVELARQIAASFGPGGSGMWTTPLSVTGAEPASHYISSGYVPPEYGYLVPLQTWAQEEDGTWVMIGSEPGDPVAVYDHCVEAGVACTQADVDALFAAADVTEQEPFTAMGRLGIMICNSAEQAESA
jgi:hypothetical protein